MRSMPTRIAVLLVATVASLAAIALSQPSWPSGVWGVLDQLVTSIVGGAVVFGALLAAVLLLIESFWPGDGSASWQELARTAVGLAFGIVLVRLAPHLSDAIPWTVRSNALSDVATFVSNIGRLLGVGLVVHSSYRLARDYIRRTANGD